MPRIKFLFEGTVRISSELSDFTLLADRARHIHSSIGGRLAKGQWIISDNWIRGEVGTMERLLGEYYKLCRMMGLEAQIVKTLLEGQGGCSPRSEAFTMFWTRGGVAPGHSKDDLCTDHRESRTCICQMARDSSN